jgi:hypothetical protein
VRRAYAFRSGPCSGPGISDSATGRFSARVNPLHAPHTHRRDIVITWANGHGAIVTGDQWLVQTTTGSRGFLQALESTMDACDKVATVAGQLVASQRDGKPFAPSVLTYYGEQLELFAEQRARMRDKLATFWTMLEERHTNARAFSGHSGVSRSGGSGCGILRGSVDHGRGHEQARERQRPPGLVPVLHGSDYGSYLSAVRDAREA